GGGWQLPAGRPETRAGAGQGGPGDRTNPGGGAGEPEGLLDQAQQERTWQWDLGSVDPLDLLSRPERAAPAGQPGRDAGDRLFEFDQFATGNRAGNALLFGPFRLNTYEWNFAPWMQRFGQDLRRNWIAPYAYQLGVISGATEMRVVVEPDGRLGALEVRQRQGHESLHLSSEAAVRGAAPFAALPPDFPEPRLEIILTLVYPDWHALLREQQSPERPRDQEPSPRRGRR
ncbi:MAG: energy transducer TonB, partial [Candidatus Krumholzibacteriia bacterium]